MKINFNHYLFVSTDGVRGLGVDYDIRTHEKHDPKNEFLITRVSHGVYTIRSALN